MRCACCVAVRAVLCCTHAVAHAPAGLLPMCAGSPCPALHVPAACTPSCIPPFSQLTRSLCPAFPLVQDNLIHGRFLAELTKEVLNDLEASKYQHTGARLSFCPFDQLGC